jgi:serine/threonine-protein kinase
MIGIAAAPAPVGAALAAPWALSGWKLISLVGEGRWTRVLRAAPADCPDDRPGDYAVKLLKEEFAAKPQVVEMLRREAHLGRQIAHPHLISVLGGQWKRPPYYLTLPFLEGGTLADALGAMPSLHVAYAVWLARQAAEALAAVHRAGWLHGDVKPANLHIAPTGHVTVLDLGLAQPLDQRVGRPREVFAGSVAYAAPETFCVAQPLTGASDVYSLGVVLFLALTGRLPFDHADPDQVAAAHLRDAPPDPRAVVPQLPGRAARVVLRMLAKDPMRRPSAAECIDLLSALEIETFGERFACIGP